MCNRIIRFSADDADADRRTHRVLFCAVELLVADVAAP